MVAMLPARKISRRFRVQRPTAHKYLYREMVKSTSFQESTYQNTKQAVVRRLDVYEKRKHTLTDPYQFPRRSLPISILFVPVRSHENTFLLSVILEYASYS